MRPSRRVLHGLVLGLVWLVLAVPLSLWLFLHTSAAAVVATHDAVVTPTLDRHAELDLGPYLPDLRLPTSSPVGVRITLGKTTATSTTELTTRYAAIAARPQPEVHHVTRVVKQLAVDAVVRGAALAFVPVGAWLLLGAVRRRDLFRPPAPAVGVVVMSGLLVVLAVTTPWDHDPERAETAATWVPLSDALPDIPLPKELARVQVEGGLLTRDTRTAVAGGVSAYERSKKFYKKLAAAAPDFSVQLHQPATGETVALLISDRHDNIGMDPVVRAFADQAKATAVIDAGDDTATGESWETFSLDSLHDALGSYDDKVFIAGNHDYGGFVDGYLEKAGWTHLDSKPVTKFGVRLWGVDDPRSSGLNGFRHVNGPSFDTVRKRVGDDVCKLDADGQRVATLVVHDADLGADALARGCTDLVVAGHVHTQVGPDRVVGANGKVGYTYTNGTTGGAAIAIAVGSKLRRDAEFTFVTYRDGRPVGLQPVTIKTDGVVQVTNYTLLSLG
jgi:predicted phosphodiesterase